LHILLSVQKKFQAWIDPLEGCQKWKTDRETRTDTLSRNVGKGFPLDAGEYPIRAQILSTSRRKPELKEQTGRRDADWIDLAQNKDRWRAVVNAVMNFRIQ
jgi:hypothetical protein